MFLEYMYLLKNDILFCNLRFASAFFKPCLEGYTFHLMHREQSMQIPLTLIGAMCLIPHKQFCWYILFMAMGKYHPVSLFTEHSPN